MSLRRVCKSFHRAYERHMKEKIEKRQEFRWIKNFTRWGWMKPVVKDRFITRLLKTYPKSITEESVFEPSFSSHGKDKEPDLVYMHLISRLFQCNEV